MQLYYEGKDISHIANITKCVHRDFSHGRVDCLEVEFDHAAVWYSWGPRTDDKIIAEMDGYTTGLLYVNTIVPNGDKFKILATSLPSAALRQAWGTYENITLENLLHRCGLECGIGSSLYGIDGGIKYSYLLRKNEGCAAFLDRIGQWEGLALKAYNGQFRGIAIDYAQALDAARNMTITTQQKGVQYTSRENIKYSAITIKTPYATATARDSAAGGGLHKIITELPALDNAQAGRWARALLLIHNREAESLSIKSKFDPGMTALVRVDIEGDTAANGEWLTEEVEQDFYRKSTVIKMRRVIDTIQ